MSNPSSRNRIRQTGKKLIFDDKSIPNSVIDNILNDKNTPVIPNANIGILTCNNVTTSNIISDKAHIGNLLFDTDPNTDTTSVQNLSNNLLIKTNKGLDSVLISEEGNVTINNNLNIVGSANMTDGNFSADITATNVNLLGDLVSTNVCCTNDLTVNNKIIAGKCQILNDMLIDGFLVASQGIITNNMEVSDLFKSELIETLNIGSKCDLNIAAGVNGSINVTNIRSNVDLCDVPVLGPAAIKAAKIFVMSRNVILSTDESCNGIEIIIYNRNIAGNIIIRDATCVIYTLCAQHARKIIYIFAVNRWIHC